MTPCRYHEWTIHPTPRDTTETYACIECPATSAECAQGGHASGTAVPLCARCQQRIEDRLDVLGEHLTWAAEYEAARSDVRSPMDYRPIVTGSRIQHESEGVEGIIEVLLGWAGMWRDALASKG